MEGKPLLFDLGPTQSEFVHSDSHIVMLKGPMGEGKTYAGAVGVIAHAQRCGVPIRGALIRDTHINIKNSTVPDIQRYLGNRVSFHDDYHKMIIHCTPRVEMDLFGIDDPASLSKLQGPQYALIWLEEPAPIISKANAGLPRDVFDLSIARAARLEGTTLRVQITQNPADEDHWTEEVALSPRVYAVDPDTGAQILFECFNIPYGENAYLNPLARAANRAAFAHDPGMFARYVKGEAATVRQGKPVTPEYNPDAIFQSVELPVIRGAEGVRGWDSYQNPVCIISQFVPPGRLIVHDVCYDEGTAVKQLIAEKIKPLLNRPKYKDGDRRQLIDDWRDIGDPTMRTPDQSSIQMNTAKVVQDAFGTRFEPGPTRWNARIDPLKDALTSNCTDGRPKILISKTAALLHRALNGGWHWKVDNSKQIVGTLPAKNKYDHIGMAFAYLVAEVFPFRRTKPKPRSNTAAQHKMAMSYRSGQYRGKAAA